MFLPVNFNFIVRIIIKKLIIKKFYVFEQNEQEQKNNNKKMIYLLLGLDKARGPISNRMPSNPVMS